MYLWFIVSLNIKFVFNEIICFKCQQMAIFDIISSIGIDYFKRFTNYCRPT